MASIRVLRTIAVASFIPGVALLIAAAASYGYTAIGLVPLSFSSAFSLWLLVDGRSQRSSAAQHGPVRTRSHDHDGGESQLRLGSEQQARGFEKRHPVLVFLADVILAVSLMVVLVFTWIKMGWWYGSLSPVILATYATVPMIANFFIHAWLALREFVVGCGLQRLLHRARYHGIPADCPSCGVNIRPQTPPTPPWWFSNILDQAPVWMKGGIRGADTTPLMANLQGAAEASEAYRDDYDEDAVTVRPSLDVPAAPEGGSKVEEVVATKKDLKGKGTGQDPSW